VPAPRAAPYSDVMAEAPASPPADRVPTTLLMSGAAVACALLSMFGHGAPSTLTIAMALVGLVPWALVAGGVELAPWQFAVAGIVPGAVSVLAGNDGAMFPVMLVVVWVTRTSRSKFLVGATVAAGLALSMALAVQAGSVAEEGSLFFAGGVGIAWLAGVMVRRQEELTDELRALHAESLDHAASTERTRVAREVHDVVAHSLTVVMLHLTGARRLLRTDPARADEALARAEDVGRESLDSIRQVVSLLRTSDTSGTDVPLPGVDDLPALVERYASSGLDVGADLSLTSQDVEPAAGLALYRIVQESLTNVLRHAPGSHVEVSVRRDGDAARVRVADDGPAPGCAAAVTGGRVGMGVRGMGERVRALGGELAAGPAGSGWAVEATVPLRAAAVEQEDAWVTTPLTGR
jgi:signal transduction histidine kinase